MNGLKKLKQHIEILIAVSGMHKPGADLLRAAIAEAEKEQRQMEETQLTLKASLKRLLRLHDADVCTRDPWEDAMEEAREALRKAGEEVEE